jgi:hypothetical protein
MAYISFAKRNSMTDARLDRLQLSTLRRPGDPDRDNLPQSTAMQDVALRLRNGIGRFAPAMVRLADRLVDAWRTGLWEFAATHCNPM